MQLFPVTIGTTNKDGVTIFANYQFSTPEAAFQFMRDCNEVYAKQAQSGIRRSAIINETSKKEFKCLSRN